MRKGLVFLVCLLSLLAPFRCGMGRGGIFGTALPYAYEERLRISLVSFGFVCAV
jgi:hypothetical protein